MKKKGIVAIVALMLMVGFVACREKVLSYLVVEDFDDDEFDIHGKAIVGVTDPSEVPEHVKIPNGIVAIGWHAFEDCASLRSVDISDCVKKICYSAFSGCEDIDVTYKGTFKDWCAMDMDSCLLKNAKSITLFDGIDPRNLTKIDADYLKGVTRIGKYAFYGCKSLKSVMIPEGVTEIGSRAFENCELLKSVTIPKSMKKIGYGAFSVCEGIDLTYKGTFKDWCAADWDPFLLEYAKSITLSDEIDFRNLTKIALATLRV